MPFRRAIVRIATASLAAVAATVPAPPPAIGASGSLYRGPGPRPGPDLLYRKPAKAPQLANAGVWRAPPILVSGASAYRRGEYVYQDFLYDDHGANGGNRDSGDPRASGDTFAIPNGTYTYPTAEAYANNAADLVELRIRPLKRATAFRITLNTLKDPALVATTIAIGESGKPQPVPHGANAVAPAALFLTVHGTTADLIDASTGKQRPTAPQASIDSARRQITVLVPHSEWDPAGKTVRLAAGVGLWDRSANRYLIPQANADATHPGGAGTLSKPAAFFNLAFRHDEPFPAVGDLNSDLVSAAWWRDRAQGTALQTGDLGRFHDEVDFAKLAAGRSDDMPGKPQGVPVTGPMDRILASRFEPGQGADYSPMCDETLPKECKGELQSRLQPYAIYVPRKPPPPAGYGMTLLLHSHAAQYNQFTNSRNQAQFGERGTGSIVITPAGRGVDGWYYDYAGADTFEVWADVARRYRLDPDFTSIAGYSMGGYGTYKLAAQFPDLFARAQPTVGPPAVGAWVPPTDPSNPGGPSTRSSNTYYQVENMRNIPFLIWVAATDELVPAPGTQAQAGRFDALGYRYEYDTFSPADHLALAFNDQYKPAADFLGSVRVDRNPPHVSYVVNPSMDFASLGTRADHAYWISGLRLRDAKGDPPLGSVDARSEGFGTGDPKPSGTQRGADVLTGGNLPAISYSRQFQTWGTPPAVPVASRLIVKAKNIAAMTIEVKRARVGCDVALDVKTDGPLVVKLAGCKRKLSFPQG